MARILNHPQVGTIDTAVLLTSCRVYDATGSHAPVGALTRVSGLTLFQRTIFTLQRGGISRVLILVGEEERSLRALMSGDDRVHAAIRWFPVREFPPSDSQTWGTLANDVQGSCLILSCDAVFSPSLIESLRDEGRAGGVVVATGRPSEHEWSANSGVPVLNEGVGHERAPLAELVVLPLRWFRKSGERTASEISLIRRALEQAAAEGAVRVVSVTSHGYQDIRNPGGLRQVERTVFRSSEHGEGGLNGVIDRHVNRKLSRVFTPFFIQRGFSPNAVTMASMVIGLMGAVCFALGSYQSGILGACLFQLAVILDCCDGEVARLTFAESSFGQELDMVADNLVHMGIFAGIAWGAYLENPWYDGRIPLILGGLAVVSNGISLWLVKQVRCLRADPVTWQRLHHAYRGRLDFILDRVANRDFSIIVFMCACLGVLPWFLWFAAVGSWVFATTLIWIVRQALLSRHP